MSRTLFFTQLLNGVATGMLYALMGIGLSMITGILNIPNFAHGAIAIHDLPCRDRPRCRRRSRIRRGNDLRVAKIGASSHSRRLIADRHETGLLCHRRRCRNCCDRYALNLRHGHAVDDRGAHERALIRFATDDNRRAWL